MERVPVNPDNETTMGMAFDSAAQARVTKPTRHIGSCYQASAADANDKHPFNKSGGAARD